MTNNFRPWYAVSSNHIWQDGFEEGREAGYEDGYEKGKIAGYDEGYEDGLKEGYDNGYEKGAIING